MARRSKQPKQVKTNKHQDKRVNIPTQEQSDFMTDEQRQPRELLYPRDTSLDPQLVWYGKDEQDSQPLSVLSKPIYVQEKIHPLAIIENVKAQKNNKPAAEQQLSMFADFNGIEWEDQIDFYQHEQNWTNRLILGDSLQVMASLADREGLKGKVQMIYIDPPYGIRFKSNWQVHTQDRNIRDNTKGLTRQPEQVKAFRDTWELGFHSYLSYLRDRLVVSRELLTESGCVFVQMNSENSHFIRCLLDEVFGRNNFVADIIFRKKSIPLGAKHLETMHDNLIFYAKDVSCLKFKHLFEPNDVSQISSHGPYAFYPDTTWEKIDTSDFQSKSHPKSTQYYRLFSLLAPSYSASTDFDYKFEGIPYSPPSRGAWVVNEEKLERLKRANRLQVEGTNISYRLMYDDFPYKKITGSWQDAQVSYKKSYVVQTANSVIERCILMTTDPGDIVLDPTCGSGTTAYISEQWGRRWITLDTSRVALALARTRLMSAKFTYYQLTDKKDNDLRLGFVYKNAPHVTLRDIANNEEIDSIHFKWMETLNSNLGRLNHLLNQNWQEWEIPREAQKDWPLEAQKLLTQYWEYRQQRQAEIDESIARNSEQETLYDQPEVDNKIVRVTGPFTVESLSPYKPISPAVAAAQPTSQRTAQEQANVGKYEQLIIDNLREAGVQNTKQGERLEFDILELAEGGLHIQGEGEYTDKNSQVKRVAVCIGPEHGTVGKDLIKAAANEAVKGVSADLLLVCGFSFDPDVSEEVKQYGRLAVLPVRMNPDLTMASLLKKTDKANLFMVFGEPDVDIQQKDGKITVTLKGLDIYDPTTGEIRSSSTKDIACWFLDTNYDGNSFFVRHAYFTGAGDPYDSLKRALKAEINEKAWKALYKTTSLPFDAPENGRIAVKVINHYGDEVLKVYQI